MVPAPQRAMARTLLATSSFCSLWLLSIIACDSVGSSPEEPVRTNCDAGKRSRPSGEIALKVWIWTFGLPDSSSAAPAGLVWSGVGEGAAVRGPRPLQK